MQSTLTGLVENTCTLEPSCCLRSRGHGRRENLRHAQEHIAAV